MVVDSIYTSSFCFFGGDETHSVYTAKYAGHEAVIHIEMYAASK